jgi:signal transduction histidine kinase
MGNMKKLLNRSLKNFLIFAGIVLALSIPIYYFAISLLWQYEIREHKILLTPEAGREDSYLIIGAVTLLTVFFFAIILVGFVLINRKVSNRLWQPFYRSLGQIKNFDLNTQDTVFFENTDIEEFAELNHGLDRLIAGNIAAYNQQKEFADNASHELQTPLAIVQSKLEMLLQSKSLTDSQYNTIEDALNALTRVNRINKNLLLLTKIENSQFMEKEALDLSELLHNSMALFRNFSDNKRIVLKTDILPGIVVEGNKTLVEILLHNLLTNAIRHSDEGASTCITLCTDKLVIANSGSTPLEKDQLFKRFATASSETPGTGLGLAIVRHICDRYYWEINYCFENGQHIFSLEF